MGIIELKATLKLKNLILEVQQVCQLEDRSVMNLIQVSLICLWVSAVDLQN